MPNVVHFPLQGRDVVMAEDLKVLLERAKHAPMTREEREKQRRSFAYGNSKIENERITRATIDREAELLAGEDGSQS